MKLKLFFLNGKPIYKSWCIYSLSLIVIAICFLSFIDTSPGYNAQYKPILMKRSELESAIQLKDSTSIQNPGKIYFKDGYIFISEKYKGIHIINNKDSLHPKNTAFIQIPGCVDIAIKNNTLYVDNAVDLVAIDISTIHSKQNITVTKRVKNVFPEITPPGLDFVPYQFSKDNRPDNTVIVAWEQTSS